VLVAAVGLDGAATIAGASDATLIAGVSVLGAPTQPLISAVTENLAGPSGRPLAVHVAAIVVQTTVVAAPCRSTTYVAGAPLASGDHVTPIDVDATVPWTAVSTPVTTPTLPVAAIPCPPPDADQ
jgi:hypothetical protein